MDRDRQRQGPSVKEWEKIRLSFLSLKSFEHPLVDNWTHHCCTMGLSQLNPQVQSRYGDFRLPDVEKQLENPLVDILNCTNLCSVESSISVVIGRSRLRRSQFHKTSCNTKTYVPKIISTIQSFWALLPEFDCTTFRYDRRDREDTEGIPSGRYPQEKRNTTNSGSTRDQVTEMT